MVLTGNVTVDSSSTLVLEPGTVVDAQSYWLQVDGILQASDSEFMTTKTPASQGSTGAGLWGGILVSNGAIAALSNITISGAETALDVHGEVTIDESITIRQQSISNRLSIMVISPSIQGCLPIRRLVFSQQVCLLRMTYHFFKRESRLTSCPVLLLFQD